MSWPLYAWPCGPHAWRTMLRPPIALLVALASAGCSSVQASAIRTGGEYQPAHTGAVAVYASGKVPVGARELGVVEVHGSQADAEVGVLFPAFVKKVAAIGGNVAIVDGVTGRFELVTRPYTESFYYPCGMRGTCMGSRMYAINDEVLTVSMYGHAFRSEP